MDAQELSVMKTRKCTIIFQAHAYTCIPQRGIHYLRLDYHLLWVSMVRFDSFIIWCFHSIINNSVS